MRLICQTGPCMDMELVFLHLLPKLSWFCKYKVQPYWVFGYGKSSHSHLTCWRSSDNKTHYSRWFQICFKKSMVFGERFPVWLIYFNSIETTTYRYYLCCLFLVSYVFFVSLDPQDEWNTPEVQLLALNQKWYEKSHCHPLSPLGLCVCSLCQGETHFKRNLWSLLKKLEKVGFSNPKGSMGLKTICLRLP